MSWLTSPTPTTYRAWRDTPAARVVWAFLSWALFTTCVSLLIASTFSVVGLGGYCASGGPYEIRVECPENVVAFLPLSVIGGLVAVGVSSVLARGFAFPLVGWAWTILFVGLSIPFFLGFADGDLTGLIVGVLFAIMGLALPIAIIAQGRLSYLLVGSVDVRGRRFTKDVPPQSEWDDGTIPPAGGPTAGDVVLALLVPAIGIAAGLLLARVLWLAV